jgi:hypothetical protein
VTPLARSAATPLLVLTVFVASSSPVTLRDVSGSSPSGKSGDLAQQTPGPGVPSAEPAIEVAIRAVRDTVIAHETAWIEVRITNKTRKPYRVAFRSEKIPGEWKFTDPEGNVIVDWPEDKDLEDAPRITIGPGEVFYEVLSPESSFGVMTNPGSVLAFCRVGRQYLSNPERLVRRAARAGERSALKGLGPLNQSSAREKAQVELWSLCGRGNGYFDCDEALFTVAWDRMLASPSGAQAVVDTLISRSPGSGWCRAALYAFVGTLQQSVGRRYLETVLARKPGGVAETYAMELLRRGQYGECPRAGKRR